MDISGMSKFEVAFKLDQLEKIYAKQHYFIDRHEVMAEKLYSSLMIIGGLVSVVFTLGQVINVNSNYLWPYIIASAVFFVFFIYTYMLISKAIMPLSSKAIDWLDKEIVPLSGKDWIKESLIYYRGILNRLRVDVLDQSNPIETYVGSINEASIMKDLTQQIFVLAYYSQYKRVQLEEATKYTRFTIVIGVVAIMISVLSLTAKGS